MAVSKKYETARVKETSIQGYRKESRMNILVPLNHTAHLGEFLDAGATEFYMGFYDTAWEERFGDYQDLNRLTGFRKNANRYSFHELLEELTQIQKNAQTKGASIYITLNASGYSKEQMKELRSYMEQLKDYGICGVIVSNLELTMLAKDVNVPAVVSTIAGVYNAETVKIYQEFGASRVILPRDLSTEEIAQIMQQVPEMEYEIFLMRNGCIFSDSNCLGFHRKELCSVCGSLSKAQVNFECPTALKLDTRVNHNLYSHEFHENACGLCGIYRFLQLGVSACKIVGRSEDYDAICQDIRYVSENIRIAKECKNEQEYLQKMRFPENKDVICSNGFSCYYPEIRF